ncbi:hypothetical protein Aple_073680 [Acrocarpospora pleiomorpha]|uniref:Uncharacterized protein n=1 Tax=Acrocarpospora pleiomorpha TaxID=90975 RepID=A0A5M3XWL3_9ACTN|nr:hypothetical protein [Acrocarpospora pleiomorpha]GES24469.1 hypothetical protein Aple_073680 [Acrocarpospora pleiomorpha]
MDDIVSEQLHRQQQAVKVLGQLLARVANEKLPIIAWRISSAQSESILTGHCEAVDPIQRQRDFEAWREAISAEPWPNGIKHERGVRLHASVVDHYEEVTITLTAEISTDEL